MEIKVEEETVRVKEAEGRGLVLTNALSYEIMIKTCRVVKGNTRWTERRN